VATLVRARQLVLLTNVDGVFTGHPDQPGSMLIRSADVDRQDLNQYVGTETSANGTGGSDTNTGGANPPPPSPERSATVPLST